MSINTQNFYYIKSLKIFLFYITIGINCISCVDITSTDAQQSVRYDFFEVTNHDEDNEKGYNCSLLKRSSEDNIKYDYTCATMKQRTYVLHIGSGAYTCDLFEEGKKIASLPIVAKKVVTLSGNHHTIYKFIDGVEKVDGLTSLFFTKEHGILIRYSNTWKRGYALSFHPNIGDEAKDLSTIVIENLSFLQKDGLPPPPSPPQ